MAEVSFPGPGQDGEEPLPGGPARDGAADDWDGNADMARFLADIDEGHHALDDAIRPDVHHHAQAHVDAGISERSRPVRDGFRAEGAFSPAATREALGRLAAPVLVYAGGLDAAPAPETAAAGARLFPNATVTVQPGAAHFPWLDDPAFLTAAITSFLEKEP